MPASPARNRTARPRNARFARTPASTLAPPAIICLAASRSAAKLSFPPSR